MLILPRPKTLTPRQSSAIALMAELTANPIVDILQLRRASTAIVDAVRRSNADALDILDRIADERERLGSGARCQALERRAVDLSRRLAIVHSALGKMRPLAHRCGTTSCQTCRGRSFTPTEVSDAVNVVIVSFNNLIDSCNDASAELGQ